MTGDEETPQDGKEENEVREDDLLGGVVAVSLAELQTERLRVQELLGLARKVYNRGDESKFEKLREVLRDDRFKGEKLLVFTEHRVLRTLLDKLERIRRELNSDKVFDVVGRLFEGVSLREYLEQALTDEGADAVRRRIEGTLTKEQVAALEEREKRLYGDGGDV